MPIAASFLIGDPTRNWARRRRRGAKGHRRRRPGIPSRGIKNDHPDIRFRVTKRAIKISFNEPLEDETDPSVDLIVALTRKGQVLWIPNNETASWDPSDPEYHTKVLTDDPAVLRRVRARIIRLGKGWNTQYGQPGLCSFNIEALALTCIDEEHGVPDGLAEFFRFAAKDLKHHLTPDPAGVSKPIKLLEDRNIVIGRLEKAAKSMQTALDNDDDPEALQEAMASHVLEIRGPAGREQFQSSDCICAPRRQRSRERLGRRTEPRQQPRPTLKRTRSYGSEPS